MNKILQHRRKIHRLWLMAELAFFFATVAFFYSFNLSRLAKILVLWAFTLYSFLLLRSEKDFSWRKLWNGRGWTKRDKVFAALRFLISVPLVIGLTFIIAPDRFLSFPLQHPWLYLLVMVLYPILSALPQEVVFRSFVFHRYEPLLRRRWLLIALSAISFGFMHIIFHNWVAPVLSAVAGYFFGQSYDKHRSLKWAAIEHAAYGCMVFTIGIGFYFVFNPAASVLAR